MKRLYIIIGLLVAMGIVIMIGITTMRPNTVSDDIALVPTDPTNIKDSVYVIDHQAVKLDQGISEETIPGSTSKITTRYFGNEVAGDFNADGLVDTAFLLTQDRGGSGVFYYLVVALKTATGYRGINGQLLGDRISPQTTAFINGLIVVNYGDRLPNEPMTALPTEGVSRYFKVLGSGLEEVFN